MPRRPRCAGLRAAIRSVLHSLCVPWSGGKPGERSRQSPRMEEAITVVPTVEQERPVQLCASDRRVGETPDSHTRSINTQEAKKSNHGGRSAHGAYQRFREYSLLSPRPDKAKCNSSFSP